MRFQAKTAILLALTITVLLLATLGVISRQATERVKAELGARLTAIATTASLSLDGDEHEAAAMARSMDDPFYLKIRGQLQRIQRAVKAHDVDNLYTLRRTGKPNLWEFVIDTTETEDLAQPGKPYDVSQRFGHLVARRPVQSATSHAAFAEISDTPNRPEATEQFRTEQLAVATRRPDAAAVTRS